MSWVAHIRLSKHDRHPVDHSSLGEDRCPPLVHHLMIPQLLPYTSHGIEELFAAFWAAVDGQSLAAIDRGGTSTRAFLSAFLECLTYVAGKARANVQGVAKEQNENEQDALELAAVIEHQYAMLWEKLSDGSLRMEASIVVPLVGNSLSKLRFIGNGKVTIAQVASY